MPKRPAKSMEDVIRNDGRYPPDAYAFLHDGLNHAVKRAHGDKAPQGGRRHVSGHQLCQALRDLALERWGLLARCVLARWGVRSTLDFGNMVYVLVESEYMKKTDEDSIEDFRNVFDFAELDGAGEFEIKE